MIEGNVISGLMCSGCMTVVGSYALWWIWSVLNSVIDRHNDVLNMYCQEATNRRAQCNTSCRVQDKDWYHSLHFLCHCSIYLELTAPSIWNSNARSPPTVPIRYNF